MHQVVQSRRRLRHCLFLADGVIPLEAGQQITVHELLTGALLPSSKRVCAESG